MFKLEKVLGLTVDSNRALASSCKTDLIAYSAGSAVVLTNICTNSQRHIINHSRKAITALVFSSCGEYLFTSEYGQNSSIKIWNVRDNLEQTGEILPDENGTRCFAISPDGNFIVTIGSNFTLSLWNWRKKLKITGGKVSYQIAGVSFAQDGKYFVTVGHKHLKYWYWHDTNLLSPKSVAAVDRSNPEFCDVSCGRGQCYRYTYAVANNGRLYMFNEQRCVEKWVELERTVKCLVVNERFVFLGCEEAAIYCFDSLTLKFLYNLPKCHTLGADVLDAPLMGFKGEGHKHPDTIAMTFNGATNSLITIYDDHSLYHWDLQNGGDTIIKKQSFSYHSNCIWDLKMCTTEDQPCFYTCSSDSTIRQWTLDDLSLKDIVYVDENYSYLKEGAMRRNINVDYGIRSLAISSDKRHLACGDRRGIIRTYELSTLEFSFEMEEHNLEILSLEYTPSNSNYNLLASAGKDKQISIFDASSNYCLIQKINDHTSSVTAIKFAVTTEGNLIMVSATSDGTCIIRSIRSKSADVISFIEDYTISLKRVLYSMELSDDGKYALMACQSLKILDVESRNIMKTLRPVSKGGSVFKVALDGLTKYLCASCLDKSIVVYDFNTGDHLTSIHSNLVTNLCFTPDHRRLIAVTGDSCVFIWRISDQDRLSRGNANSTPLWAKKSLSKSTDILLSDRSVVPRGKWANRMEPTISIRASYTSEESEASLQTPLSTHSDVFQYFSIEESKNENVDRKQPSVGAEANLNSEAPIPPQRRRRKPNYSEHINDSKSVEAAKVADDVSARIPVRKEENTTRKQEKVSRMISQVKEKLENIGQTNRMKGSKSMSNLSEPPARGSWLLQYRTSRMEEKNQLLKGKSMSNLTNSKYYSNENLSQSEILTTNKPKTAKLPSTNAKTRHNEKAKNVSYTKKESNSYGSSIQNKYRPKLSLPKSDLFARTHTDPEIIVRKMQNESKQIAKDTFRKSRIDNENNITKQLTKQPTSYYLERTQTDPDIVLRRKPKGNSNLSRTEEQLSAANNKLTNRPDSFQSVNMATAKITEKLCESVVSELVNTAKIAVQLYRKMSEEKPQSSANVSALENLSLSLVWAQIKLQRLNIQNK